MALCPWTTLFIGLFQLTSASLLSVGTETVQVDTVLHNVFVGPQTTFVNTSGPTLLLLDGEDICDFGSSLNISGSVVIVEGSLYGTSLSRSSQQAACAELRGARTLVITKYAVHPGWTSLSRHYQKIHPVSIPVLEMSELRLLDLMEQYGDLTAVPFTVVVDPNKWHIVFESWAFVLAFRVIIPTISLYAIFRCMRCLRKHYKRNQAVTQTVCQPKWISTRSLIMCILLIEIVSTTILFFYCAMGPLFSDSTLPYEWQILFLNLPPWFSIMSSLYAVALFIRWGTVTSVGSRETLEKATVALGSTVPMIAIVLVSFYVTYRMKSLAYVVITSLLAVLLSLYAFAVFLYCGIKFIRRIQAVREEYSTNKWMLKRRQASLARFFKWIKMASIANFMLLIPCLLGTLSQELLMQPIGFVIWYWILYTGALFQSISQSYGLKPETYTDEEWRGLHMDQVAQDERAAQEHAERNRKLSQSASDWNYLQPQAGTPNTFFEDVENVMVVPSTAQLGVRKSLRRAEPLAVYASPNPVTTSTGTLTDCRADVNDQGRKLSVNSSKGKGVHVAVSVSTEPEGGEGAEYIAVVTSPVRQCPTELVGEYVTETDCVV